MDWLRHDLDSRRDPKLVALKRKQGMAGLGRWWVLVELLAEQDGVLEAELVTEVLADEWACTPAKAEQYLSEMVALHLVAKKDGQYHSPRLDAEIEYFEGTHEKKVDAGRRGGLARAAKLKQEDSTAIAPPEQCLSDAQADCSTRPYQTLPDLPNQPTDKTQPVFQEEVRVFLEAYPPTLKRQENAVWKQYQIARRTVTAEVLLEGARQYAQHIADTETTPQFTKSAPKWLEEECWTAVYEKPQDNSLGAQLERAGEAYMKGAVK